MKEGMVYDAYDQPEEVRGRCKAIANLLDIRYEELYELERDTSQGTQAAY